LLGAIVSEHFALTWTRLISSFPFSYGNRSYYWSVGQPLGAFSSWAMFALTHHFVIQYCAYKASNRPQYFTKYALLGDDIVLWDSVVARIYLQFMNDIGVAINTNKSVIGKFHTGEFAKRQFLNGQNISGFGFSMISQAIASETGWIRFLEILEAEGFIQVGALILFPGIDSKELSNESLHKIHWLWAVRNAFAHNLLLVVGNEVCNHRDLMEQYVLQRISLLNCQCSSWLRRSAYLKLYKVRQLLSKRWGVTETADGLDIRFNHLDELISHPLVRYLNYRNNIIFDKIEYFNKVIQSGLFEKRVNFEVIFIFSRRIYTI
jgi:hypothetical protein